MFRKTAIVTATAAVAFFLSVAAAPAQTYPQPFIPDKFVGDTNIYSGDVSGIKPNVLFMIDDTASMGQPGKSEPYNPLITYANNGFITNGVYVKTAATGGTINYNLYINSITLVTCAEAKSSLQNTGYFPGKLKKSDGSCNTPQTGDYYLGNHLNYMFSSTNVWQPAKAYSVGDVVEPTAGAQYTWTCTVAGTSGNGPGNPFPALTLPIDWNSPPTVTDGTVTWTLSSPMIAMVTKTLNLVLPNLRQNVRAGLMTYRNTPPGNQINGGAVWQKVDDIDQTTAGNINYTALTGKINAVTPEHVSSGGNQQPVNEALWDANLYYKGENNSTTKFSSDTATYANPIQYYCQQSFVVLITTGATQGSANYSRIGDMNLDGRVGYVDDASKLLYETDHLIDLVNDPEKKIQRVRTIVVQLAASAVADLVWAAVYGNGISVTPEQAAAITNSTMTDDQRKEKGIPYFLVQTAEDLTETLLNIMSNIVMPAHTAFVAPTIPVSQQENLRSFSGNRVYMGFFRPLTKKPWRGNMKKYALDQTTGEILDKDGNRATYVDLDGDGKDDRDNVPLLSGRGNGDFRPESVSFWTTQKCVDVSDADWKVVSVPAEQTGDGGMVDCGGVGEKLQLRSASNPRKIYTFLPNTMLSSPIGSQDLTVSVNQFDLSNAQITPRLLNYLYQAEADALKLTYGRDFQTFVAGQPPTARDNIIKFTRGEDSLGQNPTGYAPAVPGRRMWPMGDVLHSRPVVVGYKTYDPSKEDKCFKDDPQGNNTYIYVGSNDGMLHAFRDCDGEEEWAFIPTNLLGSLRQLPQSQNHVNFVDSTIEKYVYDADADGNIESGDRVLLLFGERRGGGQHNFEAMGYYFVLDVTKPLEPKMLSRFDYGSGYPQLGETWSEPRLAKMLIGGVEKIVMFIGAGYDNCNEDSRFGATQTFQTVCAQDRTSDSGIVTSASSASGLPLSPKGRGIYALEIATLNAAGAPVTSGIFSKVWQYTIAENPNMKYSVPSELFLIDFDPNGYVDRVYTADPGGTLWRFDVGDPSPAAWKATRIFNANDPNYNLGDVGRKSFFKGNATIEGETVYFFLATGDREHPLNRAVIDRVYAFFDKKGADYTAGPRNESNLVDVTADKLQAGTQSDINQTLSDLQTKDGWFVKLDGADLTPPTANPGEKALSTLTLTSLMVNNSIRGILWVTTFRPSIDGNADKCVPGNLGSADALHFDYRTGEAVLNLDTTNDTQYGGLKWNTRATPSENVALLRSDRRVHLGKGIPSGAVMNINSKGQIRLMVGVGGGSNTLNLGTTSGVYSLYWRQR